LAERVTFQQKEYRSEQEFSVNLSLAIDDQQKLATLDKSALTFSGVNLNLDGSFGYAQKPYPVKFNITTAKADIGKILLLLPHDFTSPFVDYEPAGQLDALVEIAGVVGKDQPVT
jgi:hypothetical protein